MHEPAEGDAERSGLGFDDHSDQAEQHQQEEGAPERGHQAFVAAVTRLTEQPQRRGFYAGEEHLWASQVDTSERPLMSLTGKKRGAYDLGGSPVRVPPALGRATSSGAQQTALAATPLWCATTAPALLGHPRGRNAAFEQYHQQQMAGPEAPAPMTEQDSTQHTAHSTQHSAHSTQHTAHSTQHTAHGK